MTPAGKSFREMMDQELKPCPFCGGKANYARAKYSKEFAKKQEWTQNIFRYVSCQDCGANNEGLRGYKNQRSAREKWNTRTNNG